MGAGVASLATLVQAGEGVALGSILGPAGLALGAGKMVMDVSSAAGTKASLALQAQQQQLSYQQKTLNNYDMVQKVLDSQLAQAGAQGVALSSPSFNAIQRDTVNKAAQEQQNLNIENDIIKRNFAVEKSNVNKSLFGSLFGDAAGMAFSGYNFLSKYPLSQNAISKSGAVKSPFK